MRKNQRKIYLLIAAFILTLCVLGKFSAAEQFKQSAKQQSKMEAENTYQTILSQDLGDVEARDYRRMGSIRAFLQFSPDRKTLAVGTARGELIAVRTDRPTVIWREKIGIGKITAVEFSADGNLLYVGESSPEGNLICLDSRTGKKIWQRSSAIETGVNIKEKSLPGVVKIAALSERVYALALRYERLKDGTIHYFSKLICVDDTGREQWVFPADRHLDAWVSWFSVDDAGKTLVFGTANFSEGIYQYDKNLYALNAVTGAEKWSVEIPPISDAKRTVMRGSPNISADGDIITGLASDGRGFVYDRSGKLLWHRTISEPKRIDGVYLNAVGRDAYIVGDCVVFGTLNTYNSANWQLPTPVEHPGSNNVVVFDRAGSFVSRWQAGGSVEELAFSYPYAAAAIGRNTKTKDSLVHGLYLYHLINGQIDGRIATDGPAIAAAITDQGNMVAVVEVPLKLDDGTIIGSYKLSLAERK